MLFKIGMREKWHMLNGCMSLTIEVSLPELPSNLISCSRNSKIFLIYFDFEPYIYILTNVDSNFLVNQISNRLKY